MLTHKQLAAFCLFLGAVFHFIYFFNYYDRTVIYDWSYFLAWTAVLILMILYFFANWRANVLKSANVIIYKLFLIVIIVSLFRSLLNVHGIKELKWLLFDSYTGLSFFPALFFIIGLNSKYFSIINKILLIYCVLAFIVSLFYINTFELAIFLLMPLFFVIVTTPLQTRWAGILLLVISVTTIAISLTHRAGMMRIISSYLIVLIYYLIIKFKINKIILGIIIFCTLTLPFVFLYMGSKGYNVFQNVMGENTDDYSEENLRIDTRTFLYTEVLMDLKLNHAFIFGKGIDGGYESESFKTLSRKGVEVGFLQMLLKSGIVGFAVYFIMVFSAVFKALVKSNSAFMKSLGLLLASYFVMLFIENVFAFDLLNITFWLIMGMCYSEELLKLNDDEIKSLLIKG